MKMSNITPFAFGDNLVRSMTDENGNPWFVAKDVCRVLCIENNRDAISTLDEDEKITVANPDGNPRAGIPHQYVLISESGLYALVFRSRKPEAKAFSKWVRSEVLPTLRKTGKYEMPRQTRREALPDDLPSEALALRPSMRQKLWQDALQTARLDGGDSAAAREWFTFLCSMVAALTPAPTPARDKVRAFFHECCEYAPGNRVSATVLYEVFKQWHREQRGDLPSMKVFGICIREFARRLRSCGIFYEGICLKAYIVRA